MLAPVFARKLMLHSTVGLLNKASTWPTRSKIITNQITKRNVQNNVIASCFSHSFLLSSRPVLSWFTRWLSKLEQKPEHSSTMPQHMVTIVTCTASAVWHLSSILSGIHCGAEYRRVITIIINMPEQGVHKEYKVIYSKVSSQSLTV